MSDAKVKPPEGTDRRGGWMQTWSGVQFWPLDPRPHEVRIIDIAEALSKMCRYAGHCQRFYSVAEHSVLVARAAPPTLKMEALLHDASEVYLVDIPRPIKPFLSNYLEIEEGLMKVIAERFGFQWPIPDEIKRLDNAILADEAAQIMVTPPVEWNLPEPPLGVTLEMWGPDRAREEFLLEFAHAFDGQINRTVQTGIRGA